MVLSVEAPDAISAMALVQRLVGVVGGEAVSMDGVTAEVHVKAPGESDETLAEALGTVGAWLVDLGLDAARVSCDGRAYTMRR